MGVSSAANPVEALNTDDTKAYPSKCVRYQDAPEICFLKLQRALEACADGKEPARKLKVSNEELEEYRVAHSPKPRLHGLDRARLG